MSGPPTTPAARLVVALLMPLLGFGWLAGEKDVRLHVDGRPAELRTHAATVGELLDRAQVAVGPHDRLEPAADTPVTDGMEVELVRAREITLLVGGAQRRVVVAALSVEEVLEVLGGRLEGDAARATVRPSRSARVRPGMVVEVRYPLPVTVVADGVSRQVLTDEPTVGQILDRLGVARDADDRVSPELDSAARSGLRIVVERVEVTQEVRAERIAAPTQQRRTAALGRGEQRQAAAGRDGRRQVTERVVRVDGAVESRQVLATRVLRAAQPRVVEVGTAAPGPAATTRAGSSEPPPAPAAPTPAAPTPAGPTPSPRSGDSQVGDASYYDHPSSDGLTAAHRTLPFGTLVTVTNLADGRSVRVRINDRGPFVPGRVIDLNEPAFARIASLSTGVVRVRITW
ncbi:MAG TPA: ubiquitin-like domain-containing protein [Egibacteraceae bacterium]|nr:ubiquitin-like domain-containing protein [Egibacteraceae bacterium]